MLLEEVVFLSCSQLSVHLVVRWIYTGGSSAVDGVSLNSQQNRHDSSVCFCAFAVAALQLHTAVSPLSVVLRLRSETEHDTNANVTIKGVASAW